MPVTEESRHRLHHALDRTIGPEEATTLMEHLPPVGWADVATKADVENLGVAICRDLAHLDARLDSRFESKRVHVDHRFDSERAHVDHRFDLVDQRFDATHREIEQIEARTDLRFDAVDQRLDAVDQRVSDLGAQLAKVHERLTAMDGRLTHQFWQFLTVIIAFGAILIGVLRFT